MMEQNYQERFTKKIDSLNYVIADTIEEVIDCCVKYGNPHRVSQEITDYKVSYEFGLFLLKDSFREVNSSPYYTILPYFTYPLSIIEDTVKKAKNTKTDTNDFYKEKCDELLKMYDRFLKTCLLCKIELGTKEEKKRANDVLNVIKELQIENLNKKEPTVQQETDEDKVLLGKLLKLL